MEQVNEIAIFMNDKELRKKGDRYIYIYIYLKELVPSWICQIALPTSNFYS